MYSQYAKQDHSLPRGERFDSSSSSIASQGSLDLRARDRRLL